MFPQRRRNNLSKIMRVICGFTSCVLTLVALAIVPIAPSSASTEGTAKAAENSEINSDKQPKQPKQQTESQPEQKVSNKPDSNTEKNPSATTNTNPSATNNHGSVNNQESAKPKSETSNKDKNAAEAAKSENHEARSVTGNGQNSAQYYNPEYQKTPNIVAGNLSTSANNKSGTPKSKKIRKNNKVRVGFLPVGAWFEIKPDAKDTEDASKWAVFKGEQCENSKECTTTKAIPNGTSSSKYGVITFRPDRWTKKGRYKVHVVVHYPDGTSTSDDKNAGNSKNGVSSPVYAYVDVTRFDPQVGDLQLSISSKDAEDLKYGQSDSTDLVLMAGQEVGKTTFDASAHLGIGNISQRVICYEKDKNGKPVDEKYKSGGINGLELKQDATNVKVWQHASYDQQKKCFENPGVDNPDNGCSVKDLLYDDYVYNEYVKTHHNFEPKRVNERTVGQFKGTVGKTGDFVCKVYALKNSVKDDGKQNEAVVNKFDEIAEQKKNKIDEIDSALKSEDLFKSSRGIAWESKTLNIAVRRMSYYYQPNYGDGINILPGQVATSIVPVNKCGVGDNCNSKLARTHDLPDGTWFEIKQYKKDEKHPVPDWASFIDDEDNSDQSNKPTKAGSKVGEDNSEGSGAVYGKITVKMSTWIKTGDYYVPVVAHYPDGSSSEDEDSSNEGKPIYLKVLVNNSVNVSKGDLKLRVTTEKSSAGGVSGSQGDDYGDVDPDQGITMMRGMRFLNPYLDAWSIRDVDTKISLKVLCTKLNKDGEVDANATWSSSINGLSAPTEDQIHKWGHIKTVAELEKCKNSNTQPSCDASRTLFRRDVEASDWDEENPFYAVERTDSIIAGAPKETGDYQCAVYALKPEALTAYTTKVTNEISVANGDTLLDGVPGLVKGKDWTKSVFPIHVVEPFRLPKTGFAGWNMLLGGFAAVATCLMVLAFALDQTQWGRAFMKNFIYRNSAQKVSEIAVQKGTEVSARKGNEIKERK